MLDPEARRRIKRDLELGPEGGAPVVRRAARSSRWRSGTVAWLAWVALALVLLWLLGRWSA